MSEVDKLRNAVIATSTASMHCNIHLTLNVHFGCRAMCLMPQ